MTIPRLDEYTFEDYQFDAGETAVFPEEVALSYLALGLTNEAGEVAGKIKKHLRGDGWLDTNALVDELGDVLWYLTMLAGCTGVDLQEVAWRNMRKLQSRAERGVIKGDGDNR
jgi:NTP pyrophosphatase (non-canonical NTP hydrolase)